jgi:hypothetical protein
LDTPGVRDEDIQPIADDIANLFGELVRAVRSGEIGGDSIGAAADFSDVVDDTFGLRCAAAVVNEHLSAGPGEGKDTGTAHAARGARDKDGLA